jgi:hypothetical protein
VGSFVGQQKPRRSIPPSPCLLHCILNGVGFAALLDHLIVLSDEADVVIAGRLETIFQPQTLVAGVHRGRFQALWTRSAFNAKSFG